MTSTPSRIQASGVTKRFSRGAASITAVENVDLRLLPGELVAVTGPSLSGKTTLLELLAGWRPPDSGSVVWDGDATEPPAWSHLTMVPQGFALLEELTVAENILLAHRIARHGGPAADRLAELLATLGLDRLQHRGAFEISVGERQRTMVARALVGRPQVVLADEPVAHQDQHHAEVVLRLLREAVDAGASVIVATRQPDVTEIADRCVTLG